MEDRKIFEDGTSVFLAMEAKINMRKNLVRANLGILRLNIGERKIFSLEPMQTTNITQIQERMVDFY